MANRLSSLDWSDARVRRSATLYNPVLFAQLYLSRAITGNDGHVSFAECHYQWAELALSWAEEHVEPQANRHAFFAPRSTGKSTWWLKILPMWAAAHGHVKFAAIFADTTTQARQHATSFRRELDTNKLLQHDFPALCAPMKRGETGKPETDTVDMTIRANGFVLAARGMDSGTLGMKVGDQRPDLLLIDDPEPDESNYSAMLVEKRLSTLLDAILPLNIFANVVYSGTVTMAGSIAHQLVKHAKGLGTEEWIGEQRFSVHHHDAILTDDAGVRRSQWPEKWPLSFLEEIEHTRQYAKNYANDPMGADGDYWSADDYQYGEDSPTKMMISVDPAVTVKQSSDYTGIAVVGYNAGKRRCTVFECLQVKLGPEALRSRLIRLTEQYPLVTEIVVEVNQGGGLWDRILHDMPVRVRATSASIKKEVRAADCLAHYQRGKVLHAKKLRELEEQQVSFPKAPHDDMVDAVNQAVLKYLTYAPARIVLPMASPGPLIGR